MRSSNHLRAGLFIAAATATALTLGTHPALADRGSENRAGEQQRCGGCDDSEIRATITSALPAIIERSTVPHPTMVNTVTTIGRRDDNKPIENEACERPEIEGAEHPVVSSTSTTSTTWTTSTIVPRVAVGAGVTTTSTTSTTSTIVPRVAVGAGVTTTTTIVPKTTITSASTTTTETPVPVRPTELRRNRRRRG